MLEGGCDNVSLVPLRVLAVGNFDWSDVVTVH
jgi:hypothetical protein